MARTLWSVLLPHLSIRTFSYAPFGLAPCPARTQRLFAEERDHQDCRAKACHRKQCLYNARGNYVANNTNNEDFDKSKDNTYPAGTILHMLDSAIG
jgi:hypothetical protein